MEPDTLNTEPNSPLPADTREAERLSSLLSNLSETNDYNDSEDDEDYASTNISELQGFLERNPPEEVIPDEEPQIDSNAAFSFCPTFFSLILFSTYFLGICSAIVVILIVDKDPICDQQLHLWVIVQLVILVFSFMVRIWTTVNQYKRITIDNQNISIFLRLQSRTALFLQRIMNMFWCVWFLIGMVWTFKSQLCYKTSPPLYILSLTIIIINLFLIGMCILCCLCAFVCFGFFYMLNPEAFGQQSNRGATKKVIDKLETKKYHKSLLDDADDAKCAICLSTYEEGDELRFLPCKPKNHHYHRDCMFFTETFISCF